MKEIESYQLNIKEAKFYEKHFVPTLFKKWAELIVEELNLEPSNQVLDIACGTGIVARTVLKKGIESIDITGCDLNAGMLQVASEIAPNITWTVGNAEHLPFENNSFDKISCQFGVMFFQDPIAALNEMIRVLDSNGKIIISIWNTIEENEGYYDLLILLEKIGEPELGSILRSPFILGKKQKIEELIKASNVQNFKLETIQAGVEFPSIEYWIDCDIKASPIATRISEEQYSYLVDDAKIKLNHYVDSTGKVRFNLSAHIVSIF